MDQILIFAKYPIGELLRDGMYQRIKAIDEELRSYRRIYIDVAFRRNLKKEVMKIEDDVKLYKLNVILHFFTILSLIKKNRLIYIHSLYNFFYISFFSFNNKCITFDLHGTVPQEEQFKRHLQWARLYKLAEKRAYKKCENFVYVSEEMRDYYLSQYPFSKLKNHYVKPIYPSNVFKNVPLDKIQELRDKLGVHEEDIVFIYSGNMQKWQNVDLMLERVREVYSSNMFFVFLTGDIINMTALVNEKFTGCSVRYVIDSVGPDKLGVYYAMAHYGFILRDDHILNRVSSPTKLTEYLFYGIYPIVKYEKLGDAYRYGYEFYYYNDNFSKLRAIKSSKNRGIANLMLKKNGEVSIHDVVSK